MKYGVKTDGRSTGQKFQTMGKVLLPMILPNTYHIPVLLPRVLEGLKVKKGGKYIDATLGGGGYTDEVLKLGGVVLGIDQDKDAIDYIKKFKIQNSKFKIGRELFLEQGNFADIKVIADKYEFREIEGIVFDLGMSSYQMESSGRGFSYQRDEPLDMRMGENISFKAADIINKYSRDKLYEIFTKNAEELHSRAIVSAIIRSRTINGPIERTVQLGTIIEGALRKEIKSKNSWDLQSSLNKSKARIFQALRIEVNNEIVNLKNALQSAIDLLKPEGRLVILSYHSLEDRTVKTILKEKTRSRTLSLITKKPIIADNYEQMVNSRSKSAKLRIAKKI